MLAFKTCSCSYGQSYVPRGQSMHACMFLPSMFMQYASRLVCMREKTGIISNTSWNPGIRSCVSSLTGPSPHMSYCMHACHIACMRVTLHAMRVILHVMRIGVSCCMCVKLDSSSPNTTCRKLPAHTGLQTESRVYVCACMWVCRFVYVCVCLVV